MRSHRYTRWFKYEMPATLWLSGSLHRASTPSEGDQRAGGILTVTPSEVVGRVRASIEVGCVCQLQNAQECATETWPHDVGNLLISRVTL